MTLGSIPLAAITAQLLTTQAVAQAIPVAALKPANATSAEEFVNVYGVRELRDGRILATQSGPDSKLVVLDFDGGTSEPIGRKGRGPGEFEYAGHLYALGGDTTMLDAGSKRWLLLHGARIVATSKPDDPVALAVPMLRGADSIGHLLASNFGAWTDDSSDYVSVSRRSAAVAPAARVSLSPEPGYPPKPTQRGNRIVYGRHPWRGVEGAHLFGDGWLAVARMHPYRVDWRSPDGRWTRGAPLPVTLPKVDDREKRAFMAAASRQSGRPVQPPSVHAAWPKNVPPILYPSDLIGTADGRLVVPRNPTADHPGPRYDIIDRRGRLERQVTLKENQRLVAVGAKSAYVAETDVDGIVRLSRHPWP